MAVAVRDPAAAPPPLAPALEPPGFRLWLNSSCDALAKAVGMAASTRALMAADKDDAWACAAAAEAGAAVGAAATPVEADVAAATERVGGAVVPRVGAMFRVEEDAVVAADCGAAGALVKAANRA